MINIVAYPNASGSRYWRLEDPFKYLNKTGKFNAIISTEGITDKMAKQGDIHILQSCVDKEGIALLHYYQQEQGKKIITEVDDFLEINKDNPHSKEHEMVQAREVIEITMGIADAITTTTPYLANKLKKFNNNTYVLPNLMDMERWDGTTSDNTSDTIRIGWCGSITHLDDIKSVVEPLKQVLRENKNVQLVLVGDLRFRELFEGYNVECMLGVPFSFYPTKLRGLRFDIGIAPLIDNEFNRCKSAIKFYEMAIAGATFVGSKTVYSVEVVDGETGFIVESGQEWVNTLNMLIKDKRKRSLTAKNAKAFVLEQKSLEKGINKWTSCYSSVLGLK